MEVNKVIYILLAVFLGSFGIHKFYAGKPIQGLLHVLAIIRAVLTLFKPADANGNVRM